jgi:DNA-nicking Smr family endonuclease
LELQIKKKKKQTKKTKQNKKPPKKQQQQQQKQKTNNKKNQNLIVENMRFSCMSTFSDSEAPLLASPHEVGYGSIGRLLFSIHKSLGSGPCTGMN